MKYLVERQKQFLFILVVLVLVVCVQNLGFAAVGGRKIYWSEWQSIRRANLDGTNVEDVIIDLSLPSSITLDFQNKKLFWIEDGVAKFKNITLGYRKIMRANADGTNIEEIIGGYTIPPEGGSISSECVGGGCKTWIKPEGQEKVEIDPEELFHPICLAVDNNREHIYWFDLRNSKFQRANLDGSRVKDIHEIRGFGAYDIKLDLERGKLYWVKTADRAITRMNLDGTIIEDVIFRWNTTITSIGLDVDARQIYWTSINKGIIHRSFFNGDNIEEVVTGLKEPNHINVDSQLNKLYWTSWDRRADLYKIQQANLDGSDVTDVVTDLRRITGLALDTEGIFAVEPAGKLTTLWGKMKR